MPVLYEGNATDFSGVKTHYILLKSIDMNTSIKLKAYCYILHVLCKIVAQKKNVFEPTTNKHY